MRPSRTLLAPVFLLAAVLCVAVAVCADPTPTGTATPADTGRATDGGELAGDGWLAAAGDSGIVDPFGPRLALEISTDGELLPSASVTLTITGEAREVINSGEVVVRLPTKAAMDYAGEGQPLYYPIGDTVPAEASWRLPAMVEGDTWEGTVTVPGADAGYYMVAVTADTEGPASDLGPYLFDDSYTHAWMFVSDTDGQLTDVFEDSLFAAGVLPVPGPFTTEAEFLARPSADGDHESYYLEVSYWYDGWFRPAVGAQIWGQYYTTDRKPQGPKLYRTVPESGIVKFPCPTANQPWIRGKVSLPENRFENRFAEGRDEFVKYWVGHKNGCSDYWPTQTISGSVYEYKPWRNLNDAIPLINDHFGYSHRRSGKVKWKVDLDDGASKYNPVRDWSGYTWKIVFNERGALSARTAAHEYTHALQHRAMGGLITLGLGLSCFKHYYWLPSGYACALQEGLAGYGAWVGAPDDRPDNRNVEDCGFPGSPCDSLADRKPETEGFVAMLFNDLIDARTGGPGGTLPLEPEDKTHYDPHYVMKVFATCEADYGFPFYWQQRDEVADFVWCLENRVDTVEHHAAFPNRDAPKNIREYGREPSDWNADSIRATWLWNLK